MAQTDRHSGDIWAAIDLGSNSFHLLLARVEGGSFVVVERLKEKVQLLAGARDGELQENAIARGLACLGRFEQRLRGVAPEHIRIVGTYALRQAANAEDFLADAEALLGAPVEVVSGTEEARLIFLGVAHHLLPDTSPRLVVAIGGGSTEIAVGAGLEPERSQSVALGCVTLTEQFFDSGLQSSGFAAAYDRACEVFREALTDAPWDLQSGEKVSQLPMSIGTSGTVDSIRTVLAANGWGTESITRAGLDELASAITEQRWMVDGGLPGLAPDRVDIFPAGVAILRAAFDVLDLTAMTFADVSLMQGSLCDRYAVPADPSGEDRCEQTVQALADRFGVDPGQAARVLGTVRNLQSHAVSWLSQPGELRTSAELLSWAARLHEIGLQIGAQHYHRHGSYVLQHAQMPGFADREQRALALLVRGHRRSWPGLSFKGFAAADADFLMRLLALLRLAVIAHRSHCDDDEPEFSLQDDAETLVISVDAEWLASHPLSAAELKVEQAQLAGAKVPLRLMLTDR